MSNITQKGQGGPLALVANGAFQTSTDSSLATLVGTRWDLSDGREVILASTPSGTAVVAGTLYQDAAIVANHQGLVVTATQVYSANGNTPATVTVTLGGTAATLNQYQGGFAVIDSGTGIGQTLRIASNPAQATTNGALVVTLEDGPAVALDTTSTVCLIPPHAANIVINPTTPTGAVAGVGLYAIPASSYGFLVSKGLVSAVSDSSVAAVGKAVSPSTGTAGAVTVFATSTAVIGYSQQTAVSAKARTIFLNV